MLKRLLVLGLGVFAAGSVGAAPEELKSSDIGIYGSAWMPWIRENPRSIDFLVYQVGPNRPVPVIVEDIGFAADHGIKVVLTPKLPELEASASASSREQAVMTAIERVLRPLAEFPLVAVSIGEENIHWDGWSALLDLAYQRLRSDYPGRDFYQWYSPTKSPRIPGVQWPNLPADGWIFDQYFLDDGDYERYVRGLIAMGKPVISVVWASPFWRPGRQVPERDPAWWNREGWALFYEQIKINRDLGVPTALFLFEILAPKQFLPLFKSEKPCLRDFMHVFTDKTVNTFRSLDDLPSRPMTRPDWIPSACGG